MSRYFIVPIAVQRGQRSVRTARTPLPTFARHSRSRSSMINQHNSLIGFLVYDAQRAIAKSLETALQALRDHAGPMEPHQPAGQRGRTLAEATGGTHAQGAGHHHPLPRHARAQGSRGAQPAQVRPPRACDLGDGEGARAGRNRSAGYRRRGGPPDRGHRQADLDTFVAVLAKLKENADNYSNNG